MIEILIGLGLIAAALIIIEVAGFYSESEQYNDGICPKCQVKLKYIRTDHRGRRGYGCDCCAHTVWVSFKLVDALYEEDK